MNGRVMRRVEIRDGRKPCAACKQELEVRFFHRNRRSPSGYASYCRECHNSRYPDQRPRQEKRRKQLLLNYGMTPDEYERLKLLQDGRCKICGLRETALTRTGEVRILSVDHDHKTGAVRGLVCHRCNIILGWARDNAGLLLTAAAYLSCWSDVPSPPENDS